MGELRRMVQGDSTSIPEYEQIIASMEQCPVITRGFSEVSNATSRDFGNISGIHQGSFPQRTRAPASHGMKSQALQA